MSAVTTSATAVGWTTPAPAIQRTSAPVTSAPNRTSRRDSGPRRRSSSAAQAATSGLRLSSGRQSAYARSGTATSSGSANAAAVRNHAVHPTSIPVKRSMKSAAMRFGASAVRNRELVTQLAANAVQSRYVPIRRADGASGSEPYRCGIPRTIGYTMPALRAVFDGVNGASSASTSATA
jgi:hypothetical protein